MKTTKKHMKCPFCFHEVTYEEINEEPEDIEKLLCPACGKVLRVSLEVKYQNAKFEL